MARIRNKESGTTIGKDNQSLQGVGERPACFENSNRESHLVDDVKLSLNFGDIPRNFTKD